jgi:hypothetical protein
MSFEPATTRFSAVNADALAAPTAFRWFFERAPDVGNVHSGFANSLRDSWAESIRKLLKKAGAGTRRTLWITGHSLGGALAVLAGGACAYDPDTLLRLPDVHPQRDPIRSTCRGQDAARKLVIVKPPFVTALPSTFGPRNRSRLQVR